MNSKTHNQRTTTSVVVRIFAIAAVMLSLSACSNHSSKQNCCADRGDQFEVKQKVNKVYLSPDDNDKKHKYLPINTGDEYEIVRTPKKSNTFKFVPGKNFTGDRGWADLKLNYKPGSDANRPIALVAEVCGSNQGSNKSGRDVTIIDVQDDYINLVGSGLESLEGQVKFKNGDHTIHIFHVRQRNSNKVRLLVFFCDTYNCNHNGMID